MATITIKTGDTDPPVEVTLKDDDGVVVDLTGATVKFIVSKRGVAPIVDGAATLVDAAAGSVRYLWTAADTAISGVYMAEWQITWPGGGIQTVPSDGYDTVHIRDDLG